MSDGPRAILQKTNVDQKIFLRDATLFPSGTLLVFLNNISSVLIHFEGVTKTLTTLKPVTFISLFSVIAICSVGWVRLTGFPVLQCHTSFSNMSITCDCNT